IGGRVADRTRAASVAPTPSDIADDEACSIRSLQAVSYRLSPHAIDRPDETEYCAGNADNGSPAERWLALGNEDFVARLHVQLVEGSSPCDFRAQAVSADDLTSAALDDDPVHVRTSGWTDG